MLHEKTSPLADVVGSPRAFAPAARYSEAAPIRTLYLVGQAERSSRARPALTDGRSTVQINGRWHALRGRTASFEQLLRIAFPTQPLANPGAATISFRHGIHPAPEGLLTPGDAVTLVDGLAVNAVATSAS